MQLTKINFLSEKEIRKKILPPFAERYIMLILVSVRSCNMSHINYEQKYTIEAMLSQGQTQSCNAQAIDKHKTVVSREIKRNKNGRSGKYKADLAQRKSEKRHKDKPRLVRFNSDIRHQVEQLIARQHSPEQVVGKMRKQGSECVSHETIYQHIWQDKKSGGQLHKHLRRQGRKYKKRGNLKSMRPQIPDRVDIDKRPRIVDRKQRFGDLEKDTIIGKNHKGAIVTINDRATGMLKMKKVDRRTGEEVHLASVQILQEWKPYIYNATADKGLEFAEHKKTAEELTIDIYFPKSYHPRQRGANENLNWLIRQYFPKNRFYNK